MMVESQKRNVVATMTTILMCGLGDVFELQLISRRVKGNED